MTTSYARTASARPLARTLARLIPSILYEPDTGSTATGGAASATDPATPTQAFQNLLARTNGDAMALANRLFDENFQLRGRARDLQGQVPAQGAVVLAPDQATAWQAYQQLGAPDALAAQVSAAQASSAELAGLKRTAHLQAVAAIGDGTATYKPAVLEKLIGDKELLIREQNGKQVAVVKDGTTETPIADYAKTNWSDFLPALHVTTQVAAPVGTPFVAQHGGQAVTARDPVIAAMQRFQAQRDSAANPLAPAAPVVRPPLG